MEGRCFIGLPPIQRFRALLLKKWLLADPKLDNSALKDLLGKTAMPVAERDAVVIFMTTLE